MIRRRFSRRRRRSVGAWIYPLVLILVLIGAFATVDSGPSPAETHRRQMCEPLAWSVGMDMEGWQMLKEQGYRDRPDDGQSVLYPPGCEGVAR